MRALFSIVLGWWSLCVVFDPKQALKCLPFALIAGALSWRMEGVFGRFKRAHYEVQALVLAAGITLSFLGHHALGCFLFVCSVSFWGTLLVGGSERYLNGASVVFLISALSALAHPFVWSAIRLKPSVIGAELSLMALAGVFAVCGGWIMRRMTKKPKRIPELKQQPEAIESPDMARTARHAPASPDLVKEIEKEIDAGTLSFRDLSRVWNPACSSSEGGDEAQAGMPAARQEAPLEVEDEAREGPGTTPSVDGEEAKAPEQAEVVPPAQEPGGDDRDQDFSVGLKHETVKTIYRDYGACYLNSSPFLQVLQRLLALLDEAADAPSVSSFDITDMPANSYDVYAGISLADHTLHVVEEAFRLVQGSLKDTWQATWPLVLLVAVAHDLGKAEPLQKNVPDAYYGQHATVSSELFRQCAQGIPEETAKNLGSVIFYHHGTPPKGFSSPRLLEFLREADSAARRKELQEKLREVGSWRDLCVEDLARKIVRNLEALTKEGRAKEFPYAIDMVKGILFVNPGLFLDSVRELAEEKKVFWPEINSRNSKELTGAVLIFIKAKLSPAGWLPSGKTGLQEGHYYEIYGVELNGRDRGKKPFIPMILSTFARSAGMEATTLIDLYRDGPMNQISVKPR